jgi:hypothetical protein
MNNGDERRVADRIINEVRISVFLTVVFEPERATEKTTVRLDCSV